jgi:hypothetical protein
MKRLLALAATVSVTVCNSQAGLGWTLNECIQHYGSPVAAPQPSPDGIAYGFSAKGYFILVWINGGKVSRVGYNKSNLSTGEVRFLLSTNGRDAVWDDQPTKDEANNQFWWKARRNGVVVYFAMERNVTNGATLGIWTKDDNDARKNIANEDSKDM